MAGSSAERRAIQRKIARELKAGNYRPRARQLTVKARQLASYRPQVDRNIVALGYDWDREEARKYEQAADDAYDKIGLLALLTRLNEQYADIKAYVEGGNAGGIGNSHWDSRDDRIPDMLYFYHGAIYAFL